MTQVVAIDREGVSHTFDWHEGMSLMEVMRDGGLDVEAVCGGCCSCATCHVYVDDAWQAAVGAAGGVEGELLSMSDHHRPGASRLSCQLQSDVTLDGLRVTLAPEE